MNKNPIFEARRALLRKNDEFTLKNQRKYEALEIVKKIDSFINNESWINMNKYFTVVTYEKYSGLFSYKNYINKRAAKKMIRYHINAIIIPAYQDRYSDWGSVRDDIKSYYGKCGFQIEDETFYRNSKTYSFHTVFRISYK